MAIEEKSRRRLNTLGDVQRAIAYLAHRVDRCKMDLDKARMLRDIYALLATVMQDKRDHLDKKRLGVLWDELKRRQNTTATPPPAH